MTSTIGGTALLEVTSSIGDGMTVGVKSNVVTVRARVGLAASMAGLTRGRADSAAAKNTANMLATCRDIEHYYYMLV